MQDKIIMRLTNQSEREFFEIVRNNREASLKDFYKKICRKQVYKILKRLELLQEHLDTELFSRKAGFCRMSHLPITNLYFKADVEIIKLGDEKVVVIESDKRKF